LLDFFVDHERTLRQLHLMEGTWVNAIRLAGNTKFVATNESVTADGTLDLDKLLAQMEANDFFEQRFKTAADAVTAYEALAADTCHAPRRGRSVSAACRPSCAAPHANNNQSH
jgi:hypothetical protein